MLILLVGWPKKNSKNPPPNKKKMDEKDQEFQFKVKLAKEKRIYTKITKKNKWTQQQQQWAKEVQMERKQIKQQMDQEHAKKQRAKYRSEDQKKFAKALENIKKGDLMVGYHNIGLSSHEFHFATFVKHTTKGGCWLQSVTSLKQLVYDNPYSDSTSIVRPGLTTNGYRIRVLSTGLQSGSKSYDYVRWERFDPAETYKNVSVIG